VVTKYKSIQFAPDGDWITDYRGCASVEEVKEIVADQGSRWIFYPFPAVIVDHGEITKDTQRIVDACEPFEYLRGRTIRTMSREIAAQPELVKAVLS
jgi:hypothetical protein